MTEIVMWVCRPDTCRMVRIATVGRLMGEVKQ